MERRGFLGTLAVALAGLWAGKAAALPPSRDTLVLRPIDAGRYLYSSLSAVRLQRAVAGAEPLEIRAGNEDVTVEPVWRGPKVVIPKGRAMRFYVNPAPIGYDKRSNRWEAVEPVWVWDWVT